MDERKVPDTRQEVSEKISAQPRRLRVWVTPRLEQLDMKDAMAGLKGVGADLGCS